jgi:hypothetical protein
VLGGGSRWCGTRSSERSRPLARCRSPPSVELQVSLLGRQSRRGLDKAPGDAGAPCLWDDVQAEDLRR